MAFFQFFRFPILAYEVSPVVLVAAVLVSVVAAGLGSRSAVLRAIRLPPAEASYWPRPFALGEAP